MRFQRFATQFIVDIRDGSLHKAGSLSVAEKRQEHFKRIGSIEVNARQQLITVKPLGKKNWAVRIQDGVRNPTVEELKLPRIGNELASEDARCFQSFHQSLK